MFKRLFNALRRKREGNVASLKDAGNVSVPEEDAAPLKFEKTDKKVELIKEPVAEVQETSVATGVSQTDIRSTSVETLSDRLHNEAWEEKKDIEIKEKNKKYQKHKKTRDWITCMNYLEWQKKRC